MINHEHGIIEGLNTARDFMRSQRGIDIASGITIRNGMKPSKSIRSMISWVASLFLRDGSRLEFFSGVGILGWATLSDISTDKNVVSASMTGAQWLVAPDNLVWLGYVLGAMQLLALISTFRPARVLIALLVSCHIGLLTMGVWISPPVHPPGSAFYGMAWGMDVYIFLHLCRRNRV